MPNRRLRDILCKQELLHVPSDETVLAASKKMAARGVSCVPVIDDGTFKGIFTEGDLLRRVVAEDRDPKRLRMKDVMSTDIISIDADSTGFEAYRLMHENNVRHIVVTGIDGDPANHGYGIIVFVDFRFGELRTFGDEVTFEAKIWEEI